MSGAKSRGGGRARYLAIFALFLILLPVSVSAAWIRPLVIGSVGTDVRELQQFLKDRGLFPLAETTTFFGQITHDALAKFQASVGLEAVGQVGPKTLALLNGSAVNTTTSAISERPLYVGTSGADVSALQQFLKDKGFYTYPEITGYFGPITEAAVKAFQAANGLEAVGYVGPQTHAKITETVGTSHSATTPTDTTPAPVRHGGGGGGSSADTTAPAVSSVSSGTPTDTTATITWTTDESADSQVEYGATTAYGATTTLDTTMTTSHSVGITGLTGSTAYHYHVRSADSSGNATYSSDGTFTTSATPDVSGPVISSLSSGTPTNATTTVTWNTNEAASSRVEYGLTTSYGSTISSLTLVTNHSIPLSGLAGGVTYHYRVISTDAANNTSTSSDQTFATPWMVSGSVFDFDFANNRYWFDSVEYSDETSALAASGGSKTGIQRTFGPYSGANPELITNGDFPTNLTGWTSILNGASTATIVSAAARFTSDGTTGTGAGGAGITQGFTTLLDNAYCARYDVLTGTSGMRIGGTSSNTAAGPAGGTKSVGNNYLDTFSSDGSTSYFYAFRNGAGNGGLDNVSVKECVPFKNFIQGGTTVEIAGVTPAAISGTKILWSAGQVMATDAGDEVQIHYNASGEVHVLAKYANATGADLNLGTVAINTAFTVRAGFTANGFYGQLNGGLVQEDTSGSIPGFGVMRIGSSLTGTGWDGSIDRVTVQSGGGGAQFYSSISSAIRTEGDSYMHGAGGVVLATTLRTLMNRNTRDTSLGGSTMTDIRDRVLSSGNAYLLNQASVFWDGDQNGITTVDAYLDLLEEAITGLGIDHFVVVPTGVPYGSTDATEDIAIRDGMYARWPDNFLDWRNYIANTSGVINQNRMLNYPTDTTHLNQTAMDEMAAGIKSFIEAKGW